MLIEFKNRYKIQDFDVECKILMEDGKITLLSGPNGGGKSSFIQILKLNQMELLNSTPTSFIDQFPLKPLNDVSYAELEENFSHCRFEQLDIYSEIREKIKPYINKPIKSLSGGQNQMIKIALGIYLSGNIFVFDEAFQYLDISNQEFLKKILTHLKSKNKKILVIEHRNDLISDIVDIHANLHLNDRIVIQYGT